MNKFEKLIEYIINDEDQKARELFHDIVVEKSRDIYESIMDEEQVEENIAGNQVEDMVDQVSHEEAVGEDDEEGEELELGGDEPAGNEFGDEEVPGDEVGGEESHDDTVMNIDAKLDELLAKFDEIMGDDGMGGDDVMGGEEPAGDEFGGEQEVGAEQPEAFAEAKEGSGNPFAKGSGKSGSAASGKSGKSGSAASGKSGKSGKPFEGKQSTTELMREYVDKIQDMNLLGASEGDAVGAAGKKTGINDKSITGPGADFGGNVIKRTGADEANPDGTSAPSADKPQEIKSGNRNVPGGKAGSPESTGHEYTKDAKGAEGKTTDGTVPVAKKSVQVQNTGRK